MLCRQVRRVPLRLLICKPPHSSPLFSPPLYTPSSSNPCTFYSTKSKTPQQPPVPSTTQPIEDELAHRELRVKMVKEWQEKTGNQAYAVHHPTTHSIQQMIDTYSHLKNGEKVEDVTVSVSGRITSWRMQSQKLSFYDITSGGAGIQVMATLARYSSPDEYDNMRHFLRRGDIIHVKGIPGKTGTGELSVIPKTITLLTPCLRVIPEPSKLTNKETRYRNRHLDILSNSWVKAAFITRAKMISFLRHYLDSRGFLEVETPILATDVGGATARPFQTYSNSLNIPLHLRIAPELFLKRLVIGGFERVYEIGKQFRNEGIDLTHNPEFTTCEFYQAYADYEELMKMTEHFLSVTGSPKIQLVQKDQQDHASTTATTASSAPIIDFSAPFQRVSFVSKLQEILGDEFPSNFNSYESIPQLLAICEKHKVSHPSPHTPARLLDALFSHFVEPLCIQPTFVIDHPLALSPLAKLHRSNPMLVERFELIIGGKEIVNAYSELNDPNEQRIRFVDQQKDRLAGDAESQAPDEHFCDALEYGLPPTAGWGIGLDRLCMMLVHTNSIKDVILFPTMKPKTYPCLQHNW